MTHLDNFNALEAKAAEIGQLLGVLVTVEVAVYWKSGVQQVDYYIIHTRSTGTRSEPLTFFRALDYLDGLHAGASGHRAHLRTTTTRLADRILELEAPQ